jgi:uncharacterized damage-inducible protein DinB
VWGAAVVIVGLLVVGTIVTAFFGIQARARAGAEATQKVADMSAEAAQQVVGAQQAAQDKVIAVAAFLDSDKADEVVEKFNLRPGSESS